MTQPPPPPASAPDPARPAAEQDEKGLGPVAWIAIGCGVLLIVGVLVVAALGLFGAKKVKDYVDEAKEDPGMAIAETIALANPEIEIVDKHPEDGRVTIENTRTGEVTTVDVSKLKEGEIEWETDGRTSSVGIDAKTGTARVESEDEEGRRTTQEWGAEADEIPAWVPRYPGASVTSVSRASGPDGVSGAFSTTVDESVDDLIDHYRTTLEAENYTVTENRLSGPDGEGGMVVGRRDEDGRTLSFMISSAPEGTKIVTSYRQAVDE